MERPVIGSGVDRKRGYRLLCLGMVTLCALSGLVPPAHADAPVPALTLDALDLTVTQSRALAGDTWVADFGQGWITSAGTEAELSAGATLRRGRWQARLLWRGRWGEYLPARGRLDEACLEGRLSWLHLRAGRASLHWAPARAADFLISTNARPLDHLRLSARRERLPALPGSGYAETFLAYLDDRVRAVPYPLLWGMRARWSPAGWLSLEAQRTIMMGGGGRTQKLTGANLWDIFLGRGESASGAAPGPEYFSARETDQKFAWQLLARLPRGLARSLDLREAELFYLYAGEDAFRGLRPMAPARAWGLRVTPTPRLAAGFLYASTACRRNVWYWHKVYLDGYAYRGIGLGHPLGSDARLWQFNLAASLRGGEIAAIEIARERRGIHRADRGIPPGGHWRWSCALSARGPGVRVHAAVGASIAWAADRASARPSEGFASVGVSLDREGGVVFPDRSTLWGAPEGD